MKTQAFTLLELLVVAAVIAILAAIALPVYGSLRKGGEQSREVHAGRELAAAYLTAANENDGELMPGYAKQAEAWDDLGRPVPSPVCNRYPWRLAKYLQYRVVGTLLVNEQTKIVELRADQQNYNYMVSLAPTFGMNAFFVGGEYRSSLAPTAAALSRFGKFCALRLVDVPAPARQIVFASARYRAAEGDVTGYHLIEPPYVQARNWSSSYSEAEDPKRFGYLHLRYKDRAVTMMLDGHAELLDATQLQDMRRWSIQASEANDEFYVLGKN